MYPPPPPLPLFHVKDSLLENLDDQPGTVYF